MMKNSKIFLNVNNRQLFMDQVLVEYHYPILFTCVDDRGTMYISTCFHADAQEREWLIAQTTPEAVIDLLCNNVSIRDIFPKDDTLVYLAAKSKDVQEPVIKEIKAVSVPERIFPTAGMFMDADEDEFLEEIAILKRRKLLIERSDELLLTVGQQAGRLSWKICAIAHSSRTAGFEDTAFELAVYRKWKGVGVLYESV